MCADAVGSELCFQAPPSVESLSVRDMGYSSLPASPLAVRLTAGLGGPGTSSAGGPCLTGLAYLYAVGDNNLPFRMLGFDIH